MKKALTIILIILIIAAVGVGIYYFFDKQEGGGTGSFNITNYFPFGKSPETPPTSPNNTGNGTGNTTGTGVGPNGEVLPTPQLWQISTDPQSGAVVFQTNDASSSTTAVRYLDRATGNVFESKLSVFGQKRISNTTIPKVYEALWLPKGNSLVLRYTSDDTDTIKSLYAKIVLPVKNVVVANATSTTSATSTEISTEINNGDVLAELQGTFLPANISSLSIEPTGGKIFYLTPGQLVGSTGFVANADGGSAIQIFDSPLREWLTSWPKAGTIALNTKPSGGILGYLYFIDSKTGKFEKVLGGINGLTTLVAPNGLEVLYSESGTSNTSFGVYTIKTALKQPLPLRTLPEKCVWSSRQESTIYCAVPKSMPSAKFPDAWYQGLVSFNDIVWKINISTGESEIVAEPVNLVEKEIDAINLILDQDEKYLVFTNKKNYQLWGLRISK